MVAKLQGIEEYMKGRGLEYLYFSVHDDDIDGNQLPSVYKINGLITPLQWKLLNYPAVILQ